MFQLTFKRLAAGAFQTIERKTTIQQVCKSQCNEAVLRAAPATTGLKDTVPTECHYSV